MSYLSYGRKKKRQKGGGWNQTGYIPTEDELAKHAADYADIETVQKLKRWLRRSLHTSSDGWVSNDMYDAVVESHHAVYQEWIQTARESELCEEGLMVENAKILRPFDARY